MSDEVDGVDGNGREREGPDQDIRIVPVDEVPWDDVRVVFGTRGDPSTCWCQYFKVSGAQWRGADARTREDALHAQVCGGPPPGLVAYLGAEPVGWVALEPRPAYPRLRTTRVVAEGSPEDPDDPSVWAVTCFVVRVGMRRRGVAAALLTAAVEHARASGGRVLEAYPVDTAQKKASSAELYHGVLSSFLDQGFSVLSRPRPGRAVVRLRLADAASAKGGPPS